MQRNMVKKEKMSKEEKSQKKKLAKQLAACRTEQGLSKASLEHYIKVCGKQFSKLLSSQQVQAEADRVWCGVERCLFGNGKELHFKKLMDFDTIGGKSNKNGARFDLDAMYVNWLGLSLKCYLPKSENSLSYVWESLKGKIFTRGDTDDRCKNNRDQQRALDFIGAAVDRDFEIRQQQGDGQTDQPQLHAFIAEIDEAAILTRSGRAGSG